MSAPAFSWDTMLNIRKVELELITDPDMYVLFKKGMRGGISYNSNKYSKANNKYSKSYDQKQESKHIIYLHVNHLYTYTMSKFLPTNGFKWMMVMNCFCGMVDPRKAFSLISSRDHCQRSSPS